MILDIDYPTDCYLAALLGLPKPERDMPYATTVGIELPIDERRNLAHNMIQQHINKFKATISRPITKYMLLTYDVLPDIADYYLADLNKYCVLYGITTKARINAFLHACIEYSEGFRIPTPGFLPNVEIKEDERVVQATCRHWREQGYNYFADRGERIRL